LGATVPPGCVNRHLSARGEEILRLSAGTAAGVRVRDLVRLHVWAGRSQAVARASRSRTLRPLWRAGLVELCDSLGHNLSSKRQEARERLVRFEADPRVSYDGYRAWARAIRMADRYGSAEAFPRRSPPRPMPCPICGLYASRRRRSGMRSRSTWRGESKRRGQMGPRLDPDWTVGAKLARSGVRAWRWERCREPGHEHVGRPAGVERDDQPWRSGNTRPSVNARAMRSGTRKVNGFRVPCGLVPQVVGTCDAGDYSARDLRDRVCDACPGDRPAGHSSHVSRRRETWRRRLSRQFRLCWRASRGPSGAQAGGTRAAGAHYGLLEGFANHGVLRAWVTRNQTYVRMAAAKRRAEAELAAKRAARRQARAGV
jgi:hypothetical protein